MVQTISEPKLINMKKTIIAYWIITMLPAVLMLFSPIPNILVTKESIEMFPNHLGYPKYFIPFTGLSGRNQPLIWSVSHLCRKRESY
jgi:hypothetical protein